MSAQPVAIVRMVLLVAAVAGPAAAEPPRRLRVLAVAADLGETPIVAPISKSVPAGSYALRPVEGGPIVNAQVFVDDDRTYIGLIMDRVEKGRSTTFAMEPLPATEPGRSGVELRAEGPNVRVLLGGDLFTEYVSHDGPKPFFYPVHGPTGAPMTRAFPSAIVEGETRDHPHHRSLWFAHGKVNGVDLWSELPGHGTTRETGRKTVVGGPVVGVLRTTDDWLGPDGRKICEDERVVRFYRAGETRIIDFDVRVKASDGPVTFGDTKEGMFGLRVASTMDVKRPGGGRITNAEGLTDAAAWGQPSPWVDYVGPIDGRAVGVAVLNHPESFRYPTTWHVRTYGLFAANPFGWHDFGRPTRGDFTLAAGGSIAFRYRILLHPGDTTSANLTGAFSAYATPPDVEMVAD